MHLGIVPVIDERRFVSRSSSLFLTFHVFIFHLHLMLTNYQTNKFLIFETFEDLKCDKVFHFLFSLFHRIVVSRVGRVLGKIISNRRKRDYRRWYVKNDIKNNILSKNSLANLRQLMTFSVF